MFDQNDPYAGLGTEVTPRRPQAAGPRGAPLLGQAGPMVGPPPTAPQASVDSPLQAQQRAASMAAEQANAARAGQSTQQGATAGHNFTDEQMLQQHYEADPDIRNYANIIPIYHAATRAADNPQGDYQIVTAFAKVTDPSTGIRQGESENVEAAASPSQRVQGLFDYLQGGGRLTPDVRAGLIREMGQRVEGFATNYNRSRADYINRARRYGFDPMAVVGTHAAIPYRREMGWPDVGPTPGSAAWNAQQQAGQQPGGAPAAPGGPPGNHVAVNAAGDPVTAADVPRPQGDLAITGRTDSHVPFTQQQVADYVNAMRGHVPGTLTVADFRREVDRTLGGRQPQENEQAIVDFYNRTGQVDTNFHYMEPDQLAAQHQQEAAQARLDAMSPDERARDATDPFKHPVEASAEALTGVPFLGAEANPRTAAVSRGALDVPTLGFRDEINGLANSGGVPDERARDAIDWRDHPYFRTGGELAGGFALPLGETRAGFAAGRAALRAGDTMSAARAAASRAAMLRTVGGNAAIGGGFGLGSGEGDLVDRLPGAAIGAATGAAAPPLLNLAGRAAAAAAQRIGSAASPVLAAGQRLNVPIPRFMAGGNTRRMLSSGLRVTPGGVPMENAAGRFVNDLAGARDAAAANMGTVADNTGAGQAAQQGARQFLTRTADRGSRLFDAIPIRPGTPAALTNTQAALGEMTAGLNSNPELSRLLADPQLARFRDALSNGGLSWEDMKAFRSMIGERIGQPNIAGEQTSVANLRRLYGALSQDMEATAANEGPQALNAFNRANQFWRGREARREGLITDILGPDGQRSPEAAFQRINGWAAARGGNSARLGQALRSMPEDEANTVRATIFGHMGQARPGGQSAQGDVFSPSTFATQWNSLSARAKSFLVPNSSHRQALDDIATLATGSRQAEQFNNRSYTALGANMAGIGAGLVTHPVPTLAYIASTYAGGRLLASPAGASFIARLSRAQTLPAARSMIGRLASNPPLAQDATGLRQALLQAMNDNHASLAAQSGGQQQPQGNGQ